MNVLAAEPAKVADSNPESLWEYVSAFWGSFEMQIFVGLLITGLIGIAANWVYKWSIKEIEGNLFQYLFVANPQKTLYSYIAYIGAAITAMTVGLFFGSQGGFVGWKAVLWFGLTTGFGIDTVINKGKTAIWTPAQRKAERLRLKQAESIKTAAKSAKTRKSNLEKEKDT